MMGSIHEVTAKMRLRRSSPDENETASLHSYIMDNGTRPIRQRNPREKASIFSVITFFYVNILFKLGWKRDVEDTDIYDVIRKFSSQKLGDKLVHKYETQRTKNEKKTKTEDVSLLRMLIACFGRTYILWGLLQCCIRTTLIYYQPMALSKFVAYFSPDQTAITKSDLYQWASIVIALNFVSTIYNHNYQQAVAEVGIRVRTAVSSLIYRKALKLGPTALSEITMGRIVTLITRDVFSFEAALIFVNDMWIALIQIGFVTYLIYQRIGLSVLSGMGFYLLIIPLQIFVGKATSSRRLKMAKKTDERLQLTTEVLSAIKIVKMYTWEGFFENKLNLIRKAELSKLALVFYLKCIVIIIAGLASNISFFLLLMTYIWTGHYASAELISFIQGSFMGLKSYITASIPMGIAQCSDVYAALKRLKRFLEIEEIDSNRHNENILKNPRVFMRNVSVKIKDVEVLKSVSCSVEKGLFLITGNVGSGKSSVLKTILGDFPISNGQLIVEGSISYASQDPWLFPSTIKQNILFGQEYHEKRYNEVLKACALTLDLNQFENGDLTIVGDRGINLSKGQQARINLARAVYKDSDIYLFDDCLSALDAQVNTYVFKKCMLDFLKDKIVILVTHNVNHIKYVTSHHTLFIESGTTLSLEQQQERLDKRITYYIDDTDLNNFDEDDKMAGEDGLDSDENTKLLYQNPDETSKNLYREVKKEGKVNIKVYFKYYQYAGGIIVFLLVTAVFTGSQFAISYADKLVSKWINLEPNITRFVKNNMTNTTEFDAALRNRYSILNLYCIMVIAGSILTTIRVYFNFFFAVRASRNLHSGMAMSVFHSMMSFFDSHFIGNIINRFSKDLNFIDEWIPLIIYEVFRSTYLFIAIMILIASVNVYLLIPGALLVVKLYFLRRYYLPTGRSLKRLEAAARSPMLGYLNSTLEGLSTIRAVKKQDLLEKEFDNHQDHFTSASYMVICSNRAFALWLDLFSSVFLTCVVLNFVLFNTDAKAGDVLLATTQATALTGLLQFMIRQVSEIENGMTSVERVTEYIDIKTENKSAGVEPQNWPSKGKIQYVDVDLTYDTTKQQVLKYVSFVIEPKNKIGIVGRTGAGKSSIISTLFRLYDIHGKILIDDVDAKTVSLEYLRSQIAIIPQDPVLFTGTIRSNIDPLEKYTDEIIWKAIEDVNLKRIFSSLDEIITENGSNFSAGQKQLICLSRALMSKNKIIVLDEATASMDPETCALLQQTIRQNFSECTVITIAHRLNTIMDSDKVMVVDAGNILEYDKPQVLLSNKDGAFYKMVKQSGLLDTS